VIAILLENNSLGVWFNHGSKLINARHPAVLLMHFPQSHVNTCELWHEIQLPICGVLADDMVPWAADRAEEKVIGHDGAWRDQDIFGRQLVLFRGVQLSDALAEPE
jgi:hypothetical protein